MKFLITALIGLLPLACIIGLESESSAFHSGGVGPCDGCHSVHNSHEGQPVVEDMLTGVHSNLLLEQDSSSTCLNCHQAAGDAGPTGFHVSTPAVELSGGLPPKQLTPGGDFGWLQKTYTWSPGASLPQEFSRGERHGHNITAQDYLYDADSTYFLSPGGAYPADRFSCTSCHDPHGRYRRNADGSSTTTGKPIADSGSFVSSRNPDAATSVGAYRMLAGKNYQPKSLQGNHAFIYDPPAAVAPNWPNRSEDTTQTRVAYGSGMSEWCRNCHILMHTAGLPGPSNMVHAAGAAAKLGQHYADNYNSYIKTGVTLTTPDDSASFLSLVPFEEGISDYSVLKSHAKIDDSYRAGPDSTYAQVMCLTCHRAHASGWDGAARWNTRTEFIVYNGFYSQEGQAYQPYGQGRTELEATRAYYNIPASTFALNQDTLCNKCHSGAYP
jgi:hypothetical protein